MLTPGVRIVRGPDWSWENQDGGEGHVGTVCEIGKSGTVGSPDKTVVVQWDNGTRTNYRVGYLGKYDLRVIDNAQIGVKHPNIVCDGCDSQGISGMRYKCTICYDYDLCYMCYHGDKHDLSHNFKRFDSATSLGSDLPPRLNGKKCELNGIYVGAKVVRGFNWEWGNQDGGEGKVGRVLDIRGWDNESSRSVANVQWFSGNTNVYRLGHKGNCDIKFIESSSGGYYYPEHLPVLGQNVEQTVVRPNRSGPPPFGVGDKVQVTVSVEQLKAMQQGHGGWNPRMAEYIGKVGTVHRVTDKGDIRVQYEGCNNRWTFNPVALHKVNSFAVGDIVSLITDVEKVKELQKGHGEWIEIMRNSLGKLGKVLKIYSDGDLRVQLDGHAWTLHPQCVKIIPGSAAELANTMHATQNQRQEPSIQWSPANQDVQTNGVVDQLVRAAAQGHLETVQRLLEGIPRNMVDMRSSGKTALQVAAHQGHSAVVKLLLHAGASVNASDNDGDTCLHYAAFGNQPEVLDLLIKSGVELNVANRSGCTALHIAAHKQPARCIQILLAAGANPNCTDLYGDTALHDAIGKDSYQVIELLCMAQGTDFTLRNKRGFNVLHHAALKGKNFATRKLLSVARQLVDVKKDDGFSALHLASLNGHKDVVETLVRLGQADIDLRNNRNQTALLLAVSQAFKMNYSFEGNPKNRPEQNLSGASKKLTRDVLLQKTHEERRKRQEQRVKQQSAEMLQSHIRSYIVRKHKKEEERCLFDQEENTAPIQVLLPKLLFFYDGKDDKLRLFKISEYLVNHHAEILRYMDVDTSFSWSIKRYLVLCLKNIHDNDMVRLLIKPLYIFANNAQTLEYLIRKGYYGYLRNLLEKNYKELLEHIMVLIHRPFKYLYEMENCNDIVLSEFCSSFLKPTLTYNLKNLLIPYLKNKRDLPFERIICYLNSGFHFESTNSLFYCILALEPENYEPNCDSIQVLAKLSLNIHRLKPPYDLTTEDSDDEEEVQISEEQLLLSDYLNIMNKPDKVRKWLHFFEANNENIQVLNSFTQLCHNILLVYKDSIRKYLLLYKLGLNSIFLNKLWLNIYKTQQENLQTKSSSLISWKDCHTTLSVFCDMFTFYTETLTDRENSDTSETFTKNDLHYMSKLLKNVATELIEVAFPMCRSSAIPATPEILHLYKSCLNCVKMLYMLDMRKQFCPSGFWTAKKIHISQDLSRKNYLSKRAVQFHGIVNDRDDEEHLPPLSTIEQRSLAVLEELPFLIAFNTRVMLLRDLCRYSLGENDYQRMHHELLNDNTIVIRRTYLYEDAFDKISTKSESDLKHRVRIQFINSVGLEEAGIDGGGIFKEFINEVLKTAFDPNRGFFLLTADNALYPNPNVHLIVENFTDHYYFIGRLVGKAIFENILVDLPLAEFFLAKLLVDRASAHYLKSLDPVLYRNLLYLRDYSGDVSDLGLDFTTVSNDLGETRVVELKPNGRNIPVTNENRLEYIQRLADLKLNTQIKKQCAAFREGLNSVVPIMWLKLFNHKELQVIIGGDTQEIDLSDLRAHTVYGGEFTADHPTIILFWKILHRFTDVQKKQLLKFVTSCSRPPLLGFKELNPQFCIQCSGTENRMPTASTCLNLLKIPVIRDEETLRSKLLAAIEQQAGFELS